MAHSYIDGIVSNIETNRDGKTKYDTLTISYAGETHEDPPRELKLKIPHADNPFLLNDYIRIKNGKQLILERTNETGKTLEQYITPDQNVA